MFRTIASAPGPCRLATVALAAAAAVGCAGPAERPDVILISIDTLRADRLGCYGNPDGLTPTLDALARRGVRFADASTAVPVTLPSHTTLMTGRYPTSTGVRNNGTFVVPPEETTLAETLAAAGWATAAVVASYPLDERFGLGQGFSVYDDDFPSPPAGEAVSGYFAERPADRVTDRAIEVWRSLGTDRPRFLWVHYFDPHAPYAPPEPWAGRFADRRYDGEVAFVDANIGRLLEAVDPEGDSVVIVTADHGEGLDEHDEKTHGIFLYQTTMHVPLVVVAPGRWPRDEVVTAPVSLVDVLPTTLGLLGQPHAGSVDGADLGAVVLRGAEPSRPVYGESFVPRFDYRFSEMRMLRDGALKYVDAPRPELFDVAQDPGELRDLSGGHPGEAPLAERLAEFVRDEDEGAAQRAAGALDPEAMALLRSLGYVASGGGSASADEGRGRDPKTMKDWIRRHDRAMGNLFGGRVDEGIAALRELAAEAPESWLVPFHIANGLVMAGRAEEAEATLEEVVRRAPQFSGGYLLRAEIRGQLGRYDLADADYRAAAATMPWSGEPWFQMGRMYADAGRFDRAAEADREAVRREPANGEYVRALVDLRVSRGALDEAAADLTDLVRERPGEPLPLAELARVRRLAGDLPAARETIEDALRLDATDGMVQREAGEIALAEGDAVSAEARFRGAVDARPLDVEARFGLARALAALGRSLDAEAEFATILGIDPEYAPVFVFQAGVAERNGDLRAAAGLYRRALDVDPSSREAWAGLQRLRSNR